MTQSVEQSKSVSGIDEFKINDMSVYVHRMQKSILDKMFFIDKAFEPFSSIVDFGCANGELIRILKGLFGEYSYIGYDISEEMISAARENMPSAEFYSSWDDIKVNFSDSLLNISSTLHEVYSYGTDEDVREFWERVFKSGFKYIAIRDMMLSDSDQAAADAEQLKAVVGNQDYSDKLKDYESVWGRISTRRELVHYLLKYKYTENWEREVHENYVPLTVEGLLKLVPSNYRVVYFDHFTLPYTRWQIERDFGIDLTTPTHIKIILQRID